MGMVGLACVLEPHRGVAAASGDHFDRRERARRAEAKLGADGKGHANATSEADGSWLGRAQVAHLPSA